MATKKFTYKVKENKLGVGIHSPKGLIVLNEDTPQSKLKYLYGLGHEARIIKEEVKAK